MKVLFLTLVVMVASVQANEADLLKAFIPEDIIKMVIDLINSIDFEKVQPASFIYLLVCPGSKFGLQTT